MILSLLVTTFLFSLPSTEADTLAGYCQGYTPLRDLAEVRLVCTRRWAVYAETVAVKDVRGREGEQDSLSFDDEGSIWTCVIVTRDTSGNESCPSNRVAVNLPPVTVEPQLREPVRFYDIAGRRVEKPTAPGVYIRIQGRERRTVVVR